MNVEIGAEAALFPEKEYINGNFVAVHAALLVYRFFPILGFFAGFLCLSLISPGCNYIESL
jgi:hypothetical protein